MAGKQLSIKTWEYCRTVNQEYDLESVAKNRHSRRSRDALFQRRPSPDASVRLWARGHPDAASCAPAPAGPLSAQPAARNKDKLSRRRRALAASFAYRSRQPRRIASAFDGPLYEIRRG